MFSEECFFVLFYKHFIFKPAIAALIKYFMMNAKGTHFIEGFVKGVPCTNTIQLFWVDHDHDTCMMTAKKYIVYLQQCVGR